MRQIVIWHKLRDNSYYWRDVMGTYAKYEIGFKNQFGHEIVLIIDDIWYRQPQKKSLRKKMLTRLISFLQKFND